MQDKDGDGVDTKMSLEMINKYMKENFNHHNQGFKDETSKSKIFAKIDYFFEYYFIIHGDQTQKKVYDIINEECEIKCGKAGRDQETGKFVSDNPEW